MIISANTIPDGWIINLFLELTPEVSDKPYLDFTARSKRYQPDVESSMFNIGFEIPAIPTEVANIIKHIKKIFGFRDNQPKD